MSGADKFVDMALVGFAAGLLILSLGLCAKPARAQHQHPPADEAIHDTFYRTWFRPNNRFVLCCNKKDCYPTEARFDPALQMWRALHRETGTEVVIPPTAVEKERDSPDGRNHLCASPTGHVYCFIAGSGT